MKSNNSVLVIGLIRERFFNLCPERLTTTRHTERLTPFPGLRCGNLSCGLVMNGTPNIFRPAA